MIDTMAFTPQDVQTHRYLKYTGHLFTLNFVYHPYETVGRINISQRLNHHVGLHFVVTSSFISEAGHCLELYKVNP